MAGPSIGRVQSSSNVKLDCSDAPRPIRPTVLPTVSPVIRPTVWVAAALLASTVTPAAGAQWLRLRSPHFVVVGDASERELRQVADRVEGFREGLIRALPDATVAMPVPMTIVVFASDAGFTPFKPLVNGKPMARVAGYFLGGEDAHFVAMTLAHGEAAYPTVLHEYTHALLAETLPTAPMWLHEGLAEIYSTYAERADGRSALIGGAPAMHIQELRDGAPLPIEELMAADTSSPVYNEGERRGMFYAQSWALTHYLLLGSETRRRQVPEYLRLRLEGASVADAIRGAFGQEPRAFEQALREYGRLFSLKGVEVALDPERRGRVAMTAERITAEEATCYTAELLARSGREDEARRALDLALSAQPGLPRAVAGLGRLHVRAGRSAEGLPLLRSAAAALPEDASVAATFARALVEDLRAQGRTAAAEDRDRLARVRAALDTAHALDPDDVYVVAMQGYVALIEGSDLERARELLARATRLSPARQEYQLLLAQVLTAQRNWPAVQAVLGPLAARGFDARIKEQARTLLARAAADSAPTAEVASAVRQTLQLRSMEVDEQRALGELVRVECGAEGTFLHVRAPDRTWRLHAGRLEDVDLINYRDEPVAPLGCGVPNAAVPAVVTFRAGGADGEAVALEFVPGGYTLP